MAAIVVSHVGKVYPDGTRAVGDLNIEVEDGEFLVLVGPSGCGKTTALRMIAGLESITEGEVRIGDRVVNNVPPRDRDVAMVFQSYALYPHLSVRDNIAFGLTLRKMPKAEVRRRVEEAAQTLGLSEYLDRKPRNLSGGQRQRVAMGRAIVRQPQAFLMDEPLSNLDAKLRVQMRAEIGKLQRDLAVTTVYVTHDQIEAMTLGHRVAVIRKGILQQIAPPQELYDRPTNLFVAGFIGSPAMNFLSATLHRDDGDRYSVSVGTDTLELPQSLPVARPALATYVDKPIIVGIRPEEMDDGAVAGTHPGRMLHGITELVEPLGSDLMTHLSIDAQEATGLDDIAELAADTGDTMPLAENQATVVARFSARSHVKVGDPVQITVATEQLHFFDATTGSAVWDA
ncbi:MAG: multiple sugar transport system ATP-binding protein [Pseudonocardiales bacterium]|jgi:multiple sugar transport system ATP-binding protein|nr:multiple sugar transport system ATP-binding protein [Pseudonocardiales bacterium]